MSTNDNEALVVRRRTVDLDDDSVLSPSVRELGGGNQGLERGAGVLLRDLPPE